MRQNSFQGHRKHHLANSTEPTTDKTCLTGTESNQKCLSGTTGAPAPLPVRQLDNKSTMCSTVLSGPNHAQNFVSVTGSALAINVNRQEMNVRLPVTGGDGAGSFMNTPIKAYLSGP